MRDFLIKPQYHYQSEIYLVNAVLNLRADHVAHVAVAETVQQSSTPIVQHARVLILYGSETGTAERYANLLSSRLYKLKPIVSDLNSFASEEAAA